jgi:hypothetical protein
VAVISVGLHLHYVSSQYRLGGATLGGFVVPNLTIFNQPLVKGFHISATIYNLSNTRYAYPGEPGDPEDAIYQDGRTVGLKVT